MMTGAILITGALLGIIQVLLRIANALDKIAGTQ